MCATGQAAAAVDGNEGQRCIHHKSATHLQALQYPQMLQRARQRQAQSHPILHSHTQGLLTQGVKGTSPPIPIKFPVKPCIRLPIKSSVLPSLTRLLRVAMGLCRPLKGVFFTAPLPLEEPCAREPRLDSGGRTVEVMCNDALISNGRSSPSDPSVPLRP